MYMVLIFIFGVLLGLGGLMAYQEYTATHEYTPSGSPQFPMQTFTCPNTAWVDCMPSPDQPQKIECTEEFLTWAKTNCPGFEGAAL